MQELNAKLRWPLDIQLFGEGSNDPENDPKPTEPDNDDKDKKPVTFSQKDVDDAVAKAIKEAKDQWEAQQQVKQTEAQKLAKMTKEQRADYEAQKKEKELADREAQLAKRELMSTAKETLLQKGLPVELASALDYKDADACNKSIDTVGKVFEDAVQAKVEQRIKGGAPLKKASDNNSLTDEEIIYKTMMGK